MTAKQLHLGTGLDLPLETSVVQRYAFVGRSGSGKTYSAGKLVEMWLDAGVQVVVLDVAGTWYGLRVARDGVSAGIAIPVFGGEHGDIPLQPGAGALVADVVADRGISVVLDVSGFTGGELRQFATAFAERLFHRKKTSRGPMQLVLEEAQTLCPERTQKGEERMLGAFSRISKIGRNYGMGLTLLTQRPQSLSKEVLNQTELLLVGQTNGVQERKALRDWMTEQGGDKKIIEELPHLPVGTMYAWSPSWLHIFQKVSIASKRTADVSETPKFGAKLVEARKLAPVDLAAIGEAMAAAVEEQKANDPAVLKRRIAELEKAAKTGAAAAPSAVVEKIVEVERVVTSERDLYELRSMLNGAHDLVGKLDATRSGTVELVEKIRAALEPVARDKAGYLTAGHPSRPRGPGPTSVVAVQRALVEHGYTPENTTGGQVAGTPLPVVRAMAAKAWAKQPAEANGLSSGARAVLTAIAQHPEGTTREMVSVMIGFTRSYRDQVIGQLVGDGYVEIPRTGAVVATGAGRHQLGAFEPLPVGLALRTLWEGDRLTSGERGIFARVCAVYPSDILRSDVGEAVGFTRSYRDQVIGELVGRLLLVIPRVGYVRANALLFGK